MRTTEGLVVMSALALGWGAPLTARADDAHAARHYRLHDVGTLGGKLSLFYNFDQVSFTPAPLNERGQLAVTSLTAAGFASGAAWSPDTLRALPNLPNANVGGGGSNANGINAAGVIVGAADDGVINSRNGAPFDHAVSWDGAGIHRLAELDGSASFANFVTDGGLIVGYANNAVADPYTYAGTQTRAVVWDHDIVHDLGTLGGTDSAAFLASECAWDAAGERRPSVIGTSALAGAAGPPYGIPPTAAFVWSPGGVMRDLGNLGGAYSTPSDINCKGQITVISFDTSNEHFQSFLWSSGRRIPLQSLGGHFVEAVALNDSARVAGAVSDTSDQAALAATWSATGDGRLLGTVGADTGSIALDVNGRGVVVGGSGAVTFTTVPSYSHAFVWRGQGALEDLNTLIPAGSSLTLNVAYAVNERGEIAGLGTNAAGETHAFVLTPDDSCDGRDFRPASEQPAAPHSSVRMELPRGPLAMPRHGAPRAPAG